MIARLIRLLNHRRDCPPPRTFDEGVNALIAALRTQEQACRRCGCTDHRQCTHCNCCDAPAQQEQP